MYRDIASVEYEMYDHTSSNGATIIQGGSNMTGTDCV